MPNPALITEMKQQLLEEKKRLEEELSHFAHRNPKAAGTDFDAAFPNVGDKEDENASEVAQFSDNLSLEDELEKALRDVEGALGLIEKGTYGICKYCKQPIDERRLRARPTSSSCIECKKTLTQEV
jgi:RNA polymerase-binding protein DksA